MDLTFLGGASTVTGSKFLLRTDGRTLLIDCGLFQGLKQLRLRNRDPFPIPPNSIDAVVLTHAHLDHSGYLPLLVKNGFSGPIYCTGATRDLCGILLPDSGHLQEEEAEYANRAGYSRHHPALPLYTEEDAHAALRGFRPVGFREPIDLGGGIAASILPAGHIIGAGMVTVQSGNASLLFSGDLGRRSDPLLPPPEQVEGADYLLVESTYGDRLHAEEDPLERLEAIVRRTTDRGGAVLIPAFAVGRTQTLLYLLYRLRSAGRLPDIPIYVDSPMAASAIRIFREHPREHGLSPEECDAVCSVARATESVEESKEIDRMRVPRIIISASGMATGGRVLHHLKALAPDARNTILLVGHQAVGTRGASLAAGARSIKVHGHYVAVRAQVEMLGALSAHADANEIMEWLGNFRRPPLESFIVHGEPQASDALRLRIQDALGWRASVPEHGATVQLQGR